MGNRSPSNKKSEMEKYKICEVQQVATKALLADAISSNNDRKFVKIVTLFSVEAAENLAETGNSYTALHMAAERGSLDYVEFLLKQTFRNVKNRCYTDYVIRATLNAQTKDGHTALMLAALAQHSTTVSFLLKLGGVDRKLRTRDSKTVTSFLRGTHRLKIRSAIDYELLNKPAKLDGLNTTSSVIWKNHSRLMLEGQRTNCVICLSNTGLIQYTKCCAQPIHQLCIESYHIEFCPLCKREFDGLEHEIVKPSRAFETLQMNKNEDNNNSNNNNNVLRGSTQISRVVSEDQTCGNFVNITTTTTAGGRGEATEDCIK